MKPKRIPAKLATVFAMFALGAAPVVAQQPAHSTASQAYDRGDYEACSTALLQYISGFKWVPAVTLYKAAGCLALAGRKAEALDLLRQAIEAPDFRVRNLADDPNLTTLHSETEWPTLLATGSKKAQRRPPMGAGVDIAHKKRHPPIVPKGTKLARDAEVLLLVGVSPQDQPVDIIVERSTGDPTLDQIAVEAAKSWKYRSGVADGIKFGAYVRIPIVFRK